MALAQMWRHSGQLEKNFLSHLLRKYDSKNSNHIPSYTFSGFFNNQNLRAESNHEWQPAFTLISFLYCKCKDILLWHLLVLSLTEDLPMELTHMFQFQVLWMVYTACCKYNKQDFHHSGNCFKCTLLRQTIGMYPGLIRLAPAPVPDSNLMSRDVEYQFSCLQQQLHKRQACIGTKMLFDLLICSVLLNSASEPDSL